MINYYLLTKPGIILGNLFPFAAGFLLASRGKIDFWLFFITLIGLAFIIASACIFNNYIDRKVDKKMDRTKNRALASGRVSVRTAILLAVFLGIVGNGILLAYTNLLTVMLAGVGFLVYVLLYSIWKCHTVYGTAIGSISGAIPPVVGYCAVSNQFDMGALVLFTMLVLWQMPHFFAIAMLHFDDYKKAGIPVLPVIKGILRTKIHMVVYIVAFIVTAVMLTLFHYTGYVYLVVTTTIALAWLVLSIRGFKTDNDTLWGKQMFRLSLVLIMALCLVIPFDII